MKTISASAAIILSLLSASPPAFGESVIAMINTSSGRIYENCRVFKRDPDGIMIVHKGGAAKLLYGDLPADTRERLGYDAEKAANYENGRLEAKAKERENAWKYRTEALKTQAVMYAALLEEAALNREIGAAYGYGGYGNVSYNYANSSLGWGYPSQGYGYGGYGFGNGNGHGFGYGRGQAGGVGPGYGNGNTWGPGYGVLNNRGGAGPSGNAQYRGPDGRVIYGSSTMAARPRGIISRTIDSTANRRGPNSGSTTLFSKPKAPSKGATAPSGRSSGSRSGGGSSRVGGGGSGGGR